MWVEPWGKVHCSGGLENYVCYHANTGSTVGSITCSVHRLFEINSTKSCNAQNNSWLYLMLYKAITVDSLLTDTPNNRRLLNSGRCSMYQLMSPYIIIQLQHPNSEQPPNSG